MSLAKLVVLVTWIAAIAAMLLAGGSWVGTVGTALVGFLVVAHTIECFVFRKELEAAPGSLGGHLVQVFLFGVVHMGEVRAARDASAE